MRGARPRDRDLECPRRSDRSHTRLAFADALQQGASQFEQQAGKLKRKFWLQNLKVSTALLANPLIGTSKDTEVILILNSMFLQ